MYIKKQLTKQCNNSMFKYLVNKHPKLMSTLPLDYNNITLEQVSNLIELVNELAVPGCSNILQLFEFDRELCDMYYYLLQGDFGMGAESIFGNTLQNNVNSIANNFLQITFSSTLVEVINILKTIDSDACLVGGCVRDSIIGKKPKDFDLVSKLPYDVLVSVFKDNGFETIESGKQFLVLSVKKNDEIFEIANFRKDSLTSDGRRPDSVEIGNIFDDAQRRDFTVNALYFNLSSRKLLDPTGDGFEDILSKTLKFVGKPQDRIKEDSLRGIRFYRFISKGFTPDPKSLRAVRERFNDIINTTDSERIRAEIEKIVFGVNDV
jgi:hypothetical protein